MNTKEQLIEHLEENTKVLIRPAIKSAFKKIDRLDFVPDDYKNEAYEDYPLPIGYGQTISQPTTVAFMLELLEVNPESEVLDVGSGSGYTTALLSEMATRGNVLGIEIEPDLAEMGGKNLKKYNFANARIEIGDSKSFTKDGAKKFDRILVNAATTEIPKNLFEILNPGGILVIPVDHSIFKVTKNKHDKPEFAEYPGFAFVELK